LFFRGMETSKAHVTIVGGGITGLSAAYYLERAAEKAGLALDYTLVERGDRWGGKVLTERVTVPGVGAFVVEAGPDSFITQKPWALALARELGLDDALLGTNDHLRSNFVLKHGKPVLLPDGVFLLVPTKFRPFVLSPLISLPGKLRMGLDLLIPPRRDDGDETLAEFVTRRLGAEALDRIAEPLLSGIYNADAERQSLLATFPQFRQTEQTYGSLTRGMLAARRKPKPTPAANRKRTSVFTTFRAGTDTLITTLAERLGGDLRRGTSVERIDRTDRGYTVDLSDGTRLHSSAVILASPSYAAAELVRPFAPAAADELASIRYVSTGTISLAYRAEDVRRPLPGFGLVIPRSERRPINAVTVCSTKFDGRAPEGAVLLRVFFGGSRSPETMALDDAALLALVSAELKAFLGIEAAPLFHRIYRWREANPQYDVGHLGLLERVEAALPEGIVLAGGAYWGVGMPDCIHQAQTAAERIVARLPLAEK